MTNDALDLGSLGRTFDTVIDCGLFHVFSDQDRERYVSSLASVTARGSKLVVLCFSDLQPEDQGRRRVSMAETFLKRLALCRTFGIHLPSTEEVIYPDALPVASMRSAIPVNV